MIVPATRSALWGGPVAAGCPPCAAARRSPRRGLALWGGPVALVLCAALSVALPVARAATGERVTFPSLDIDPQTGAAIELSGLYFAPEAAGAFPAVVALHGCDGMYGAAASRRGQLSARHQAMADLLVAEGYGVLFPDSFNPRGRREVCTQPVRDQTITQANRRLDVFGALEYLRARPDVAANRVALLGWSHGGSAVLAAMNARAPNVAAYLRALGSPQEFFLTAIAFYPGCYGSLRGREGYAPAAPVSVFIGESDDWTSPKPCVALGNAMAAKGLPLQVRTYAETYHGFDTPNLPRPRHLDVPNGVRPGQGVTVAANAAARDDAYARMKAQLRAALFP
jgi:dienelactone hydrolase